MVYAKSAVGEPMVPISWTEMRCPVSAVVQPRKVAKVLPAAASGAAAAPPQQ